MFESALVQTSPCLREIGVVVPVTSFCALPLRYHGVQAAIRDYLSAGRPI